MNIKGHIQNSKQLQETNVGIINGMETRNFPFKYEWIHTKNKTSITCITIYILLQLKVYFQKSVVYLR